MNILQINAMQSVIIFKPIHGVIVFSQEEKNIIDRIPLVIEHIRKSREKEPKNHEHTKHYCNQPDSCHQYFHHVCNGNSAIR